MSPVVDYLTLEEYLESQRSLRSPTLQRSVPNFDSLSTPPPLVDAPDDDELSDSEPVGGQEHPSTLLRSNGRPQPSLYDGLLIKELAPYYPTDIAERAGAELPVDSPDIPCEDRFEADAGDNHLLMIAEGSQRKVLTPPNPQALSEGLIASRRASEKLNIALSGQSTVTTCEAYGHGCPDSGCVDNMYSTHDHRSKKEAKVSITNLTNDEADDTLLVGQLTIQTSPQRPGLDVVPPTRPVLPSLHITPSNTTHFRQRHDSITASPTLGRYTITPSDGHPQTLARIQNHVPASATSSQSADFRQTLPSLVTALSSATDSNGTPYLDASPGMSRPSPSHTSPYGLLPAGYAQSTPTVAMSPPRFSSNPTAWRTLSNNSSNSGTSEYASGQGSGNSSTPATRPSPSHSVSTLHSQYQASEHDSNPDSDYSTPINANLTNPNTQSSSSAQQGYQCTFQGCTAPPFQTQYLLNSHTNVHSNQRPHFCPVEGCPRGPGGQGFKRKNEMIRHGLVHQSPGYVCPFCPDQQHKYPRPDNLQRHVRVHHVDRDKDDPLLRDVLAQRPEGGSRGRRRRMV